MHNKKSPEKFKEIFKIALSYFPELQDTYVWIHEKSLFGVQHTLRAYPPFVVLHWTKKKWVYPIVINKNKTKNLSFYNLTQDEQIGLILHELSHISVYIKCTRMDIAKYYMYKYSTNKVWVREMEKETDVRVIERGGGEYLYNARLHFLKFRIQNKYLETEDTYMLPSEFLDQMKRFPDLYSIQTIEKLRSDFESVKNIQGYKEISHGTIPISRKIKHGIKTVYSFIPEFLQMVYLVLLKKDHLN